jgi:hypothetical protein
MRFWEDTERIPSVGEAPGDNPRRDETSLKSLTADDWLRVLYTGASMNPTLVEPELLQVRPYRGERMRPGDIVCFRSPDGGRTVVHRVVAVGADGVRTRGDNNERDDAWVLPAADIDGRVTAAQRGTRRRNLPGGWRGFAALRCVRLGRGIRKRAGTAPHKLYDLAAGLGPFDRLLPQSLRPRVVRFEVRHRVFLKLLMGRLAVGQYDDQRAAWHVLRPIRLFVDEQALTKAGALVCNVGDWE